MILNNDDEMRSTMQQIDMQDNPSAGNRRNNLKKDITNIEKGIKIAQQEVERSNAEPYSYAPVTPEQANERQRTIVFLKKDLEKKKDEYEQLDPAI